MRGFIMFKRWLILGTVLLLPGVVLGQWPTDAAQDLFLADGTRSQVTPHVTATSDGGCYVGWFDSPLNNGDYLFMLQRLSPEGSELWPHNGLLISDNPSGIYLMDWDLIVDDQDNVILAFNDYRNGFFDGQIYKIDPQGNFLWGADGISLTDNDNQPGGPSLAFASDGDIVVVWSETNTISVLNTISVIMMQRFSPAGELRLEEGGITIARKPGTYAMFPQAIQAEDGNVVVGWIPDADYTRPRHLSAQKFDPAGAPVWPEPVAVVDHETIPIGHTFNLATDGAGGALLTYDLVTDVPFSCRFQHLSAEGTELMPHMGQVLFEGSGYNHIFPTLDQDPATGEIYILSRTQDDFQTVKGFYGQKLAPDGTPLWGSSGRELMPADNHAKSYPLSLLVPGVGVMFMHITHPPFLLEEETILASRVDADGNIIWPGETVVMSSTLSYKGNLELYLGADGLPKAIWQDLRFDQSGDILAKAISLDGDLGPSATPVHPNAPTKPRDVAVEIYPNPFNPQTIISFSLGVSQNVTVSVCDLRGNQLAVLASKYFEAGEQKLNWLGQDAGGRPLPSGTYLIRLQGEDFDQTQKVTLVR